MKRIVLSLAALGILSVFNAPANASDLSVLLRRLAYGGHHGRHQVARENHAVHHDDLEHRAVHRELDHRTAHRYPMTYRQHGSLHDGLDHEAYHDGVEHRSAHRTRAYSPYARYSPYSSFRYVPQRSVGRYGHGISFSYGR